MSTTKESVGDATEERFEDQLERLRVERRVEKLLEDGTTEPMEIETS